MAVKKSHQVDPLPPAPRPTLPIVAVPKGSMMVAPTPFMLQDTVRDRSRIDMLTIRTTYTSVGPPTSPVVHSSRFQPVTRHSGKLSSIPTWGRRYMPITTGALIKLVHPGGETIIIERAKPRTGPRMRPMPRTAPPAARFPGYRMRPQTVKLRGANR